MGQNAGKIPWGTQSTCLALSQVAGWDVGELFRF
jgi:hypothetical protein